VLGLLGFTTGRYYCPVANQTTGTLATGQLRLSPIWIPQQRTFDRISTNCTVAAASSTVRLGIYADTGSGYPGTLVLDAGTVDTSMTGLKEITISQALAPGLYWIGGVMQGGTPTVRVNSGNVTSVAGLMWGETLSAVMGNNPGCSFEETGVTGALPATFTSTISRQNTAICVAPRAT
jgi:hypothetical protein